MTEEKQGAEECDACGEGAQLLCGECSKEFKMVTPKVLKTLIEAVEKAAWFQDHIMGKEKRVDWGSTFNIDWQKVNLALIATSKGLEKAKQLRPSFHGGYPTPPWEEK